MENDWRGMTNESFHPQSPLPTAIGCLLAADRGDDAGAAVSTLSITRLGVRVNGGSESKRLQHSSSGVVEVPVTDNLHA